MLKINGTKGVMTDTSGPKVMEDITCSVFSSFEELSGIQQEWDSFVESVNGDIYLTFDWCRIWWELYGKNRRLKIFMFYRNGKPIGLMPVFVEKLWIGPVWLKVAKMVGSDSTTNMVNPPVEADYVACIFHHVIDDLIAREDCDAVWFGPIGGNQESLHHLRDAIQERTDIMMFRDRVRSPYTTILLPKTFEEYVGSLDKRQRGNLRRDLNLIGRSFQMTQDVIADESTAGFEFEKFIQMHTEQWKAQGKLGHFQDWPLGVQFNTRMVLKQAQRGRLRLLRLLADGKVVSYQLCYAFGDRWHWRLPARLMCSDWDKYGLGRIGLIKEIEMAITEGVREIEAGAGHYDYKIKLGGEEHPLFTFLLVKKQLFCRCRALLFSKLSNILHFCYYRIWFNRLAPKLPFKRQPLWKLWIRTRL
jgi:CelD/BcsL family acetyltransferase involved in cellulose biosynthesis